MAGLEDEEADLGAEAEVGSDELESCQVDDGEGNLITFTAQHLAEAGIDIANIAEPDVERLIKMAKKATQEQQKASRRKSDGETAEEPDEEDPDYTPPARNTSGYRRSLRPRSSSKRTVAFDYDAASPPPPERRKSKFSFGDMKRVKLERGSSPATPPSLSASGRVAKRGRGRPPMNRSSVETPPPPRPLLRTPVKKILEPKKSVPTAIDESAFRILIESGIVKFVDELGNPLPDTTVVDIDQLASLESRKVVAIEKVDATPKGSENSTEPATTPASSPTTRSRSPSKLAENVADVKNVEPAKVQHGVRYKIQYDDDRVEWIETNEAEMPEGTLTLKVLSKDFTSDEEDVAEEEEEPEDANELPPGVFARVTSQFDLSHRKRRWLVTDDEVQRRLNGPEYLRVSAVEQLVRGSKKGGEMRTRLDDAGIIVPPYNKVRAKHTSFTRWTEGESKEVVTSLQNDCLPYFPVKDVQGLLSNYFSESDLTEEEKKVTLEKAKEILTIILNTINDEENFTNTIWQDYSCLTHEFAPLTWRHFLEIMTNIFDGV